MTKNIRKFVFTVLGILFFGNIVAWIIVFDLSRPQFLEVNFFDVGQGDAIFIETPKRQQILIDGGPSSIILEKLAKEMPFWDKSIDLIILTHPESDHLVGLIEVLKKYKVENVLWTGVVMNGAEYEEWKKLIKKEGAKIVIAKSGQKILWTSDLHNFMEILYPFENLEGKTFKNINDTSIVANLIFGNHSFLFTGDIHKSGERKLIESKVNLNSEVLKVAHHGSKTSTCEEFLKEVSPEIVVISVGKENRYGHPHSEVLKTLSKYGINILRTDLDGDIKIISDGTNYEVSHF